MSIDPPSHIRPVRVPGRGDVSLELAVRLVARRISDDADASALVLPLPGQEIDWPGSVGRGLVHLDEETEPDGAVAFRLRCQAQLADGWVLYEAALRFVVDVADWTLVLPSGWGRELRTIPADLDYHGNYPGWSALAQLMILHGVNGGLSVSVRDPDLELKYLRAQRDGDRLVLEIVRVPELHGDAWRVDGDCEVLLAAHAGSWDTAAADYRRHQEQVRPELRAPRPVHPLLGADPVWLTQNCFCFPEHSVEQTIAAARELAAPVLVHLYNWADAAFDTRYPDWVGHRPQAAEQVKALNAAGVPCIPYINGRCWDTTTASWREVGERAAVRDLRGEAETEIYPTSNIDLGVTCPSQTAHHDKVLEVCAGLADSGLGYPGVYIDQLGAAFGLRCYSSDHGHAPGGARSWNAGQRRQVERIRALLSEKLGTEPILTTENASEPLVDLIDGFLYYCGRPHEHLGWPVPLWQAIYGDFGVTFADNFGKTLDLVDGRSPAAMMEKLARQAIFGANLGWLSPTLVTGPYGAAGELIRNARSARLPALGVFRHGRPRPETLDTTGELTGVFQAAWRRDDDTVALAVNPSPGGVEFAWPDGAAGALPPLRAECRTLG